LFKESQNKEGQTMNSIKFSHRYFKMPIGISNGALLSQVLIVERAELSNNFVDYDTRYDFGANNCYQLPSGKLIMLLLLSEGVLWTTIRRWTPEKEKYYKSQMGSVFKIEVTQ
jgi:hypothetical protein